MPISNDELLSTRQVMEILKVDWKAVYKYISSGQLVAHKLGKGKNSRRHWRVWHSDLMKFINGSENGEAIHTDSKLISQQ